MNNEICSVEGCDSLAVVKAFRFDKYEDGRIFKVLDAHCSFLCEEHLKENEKLAKGKREPRSTITYPYTKQYDELGYTKYEDIKTGREIN